MKITLNVAGILSCGFLLTGCAEMYDPKPVLAAYDGNMVTIRVQGNQIYNSSPNQQQLQMAADTCASYGWTGARYTVTSLEVAFYTNEHHFLCYK